MPEPRSRPRRVTIVLGLCGLLTAGGFIGSSHDDPGSPSEPEPAPAAAVVGTPQARATSPARTTAPRRESASNPASGQQPTAAAPSADEPLASGFRPGDERTPRMEIFTRYFREALAWTPADFARMSAQVEQLDGESAYRTYVFLRTCLDRPRTAALVDAKVAGLREQREQDPDSLDAMELSQRVDEARADLARCEGIGATDQPFELLLMAWLTRAAERGSAPAQLAYYQSARWLLSRQPEVIYRQPEWLYRYRQHAMTFLKAARATGHPDAFTELALAWMEGVVTQRDPERAYAHAHAADLASHGQDGPAANYRLVLEAELTPGQLRSARDAGRELCERYCQ